MRWWRRRRRIKRSLSEQLTAPLCLGELTATMTRGTFEQLVRDILQDSLAYVSKVLQAADVDVQHVLVMGGCSLMPCLRDLLADYFTASAVHEHAEIDYQEDVLEETVPFATPEEVQGSRLRRSLGVQVSGGAVVKVIRRGTPLPAKRRCLFRAHSSGGAAAADAVLRVCEGVEHRGALTVRAGEEDRDIAVTFEVDGMQQLTVTAVDTASGLTEVLQHPLGSEGEEEEEVTEEERLTAARVFAKNDLVSFIRRLQRGPYAEGMQEPIATAQRMMQHCYGWEAFQTRRRELEQALMALRLGRPAGPADEYCDVMMTGAADVLHQPLPSYEDDGEEAAQYNQLLNAQHMCSNLAQSLSFGGWSSQPPRPAAAAAADIQVDIDTLIAQIDAMNKMK